MSLPAAGPCQCRWEACRGTGGGPGSGSLVHSNYLSSHPATGQRNLCLNATNFTGRQRKRDSPNATLATEITVLPPLLASGAAPARLRKHGGAWGWLRPARASRSNHTCTARGSAVPPTIKQKDSLLKEKKNQLVGLVLKNIFPHLTNSSYLTLNQKWLFMGGVYDSGTGGPTTDQNHTVLSTVQSKEMILSPKSLHLSIKWKNLIIDRLKTSVRVTIPIRSVLCRKLVQRPLKLAKDS